MSRGTLFFRMLSAVLLLSLLVGCTAHPKKETENQTNGDGKMQDFGEIKAGDTIQFGSFDHDGKEETAKSPLSWRVLAVEGDQALLIAVEGVDSQQYNTRAIETSWEQCSLRKWLNEKFFSETFTREEAERICEKSGDKLFLLSIAEAETYFSSDRDRTCKPSPKAVLHEVYADESTGNCAWWLKDQGSAAECAALVDEFGSILPDGDGVFCEGTAVRPALWISLFAPL